jgi:hypothetical protein
MHLRAVSNKVTFRVPTFVPFHLSSQGIGVRSLWSARHQYYPARAARNVLVRSSLLNSCPFSPLIRRFGQPIDVLVGYWLRCLIAHLLLHALLIAVLLLSFPSSLSALLSQIRIRPGDCSGFQLSRDINYVERKS